MVSSSQTLTVSLQGIKKMVLGEVLLSLVLSILFIPKLVDRQPQPVAAVTGWLALGSLSSLCISGASTVLAMFLSELQPSIQLYLLIIVSSLLTFLLWLHYFRPECLSLEYIRQGFNLMFHTRFFWALKGNRWRLQRL